MLKSEYSSLLFGLDFSSKWKWLMAAGLLLIVFLFIFVKLPFVPAKEYDYSKSFIIYPTGSVDEANTYWREQSELFDSEPLFLPTRWNYRTDVDLKEVKTHEIALFEAFEPQLFINDQSLYQTATDSVSSFRIEDAFSEQYWVSYENLASGTIDYEKLSSRNAYLRVVGFYDKKVYVEGSINREDWPEAVSDLWKPFTFMLLSQSAGYISQPLMLKSSGFNEIDAYVLKYINNVMIDWELPPGYYRVNVGP